MPRKRKQKDTAMSIFFILDGSGSMAGVQGDVVSGVNAFIEAQKKEEGETKFSLTVFDTRVTTPYVAEDIQNVKPVTHKITLLNGMTALYDAIGKTLVEAEKKELVGKKLVIIYTDGAENSSREHTKESVRSLIERLEKEGDWTFTFMSADLDQSAEAQAIGISAGNVMTVSGATTDSSFVALSGATHAHRHAVARSSASYMTDYNVGDLIQEDEKKKKWSKNPS